MNLPAPALAAALLFAASAAAHAADPVTTIAALDALLTRTGPPAIEGSVALADKTLPALHFGERKINGNYDAVDAVRRQYRATATVFVRQGDEFVRISTNVLTPEGKRSVGTLLARNKAYEAVSQGRNYCGVIDVLGSSFDACYHPIKDGAGRVIAVSYVGHKQ